MLEFGAWFDRKPVEIVKRWSYLDKFPGFDDQSCSCNTLQFLDSSLGKP